MPEMHADSATSRKSAWETALKLLAGRDFSASEMTARLARRGYDEDETRAVVTKLTQYGYIRETGSDREQLCAMAREYLLKKGTTELTPSVIRSLEGFLLRKGFEPDLVREYLTRLVESIGHGPEPDE